MKKRILMLLVFAVLCWGVAGCGKTSAYQKREEHSQNTKDGRESVGDSEPTESASTLQEDADLASSFSDSICAVTYDMMATVYDFDEQNPERPGSVFVINQTESRLVFGFRMLDACYPASVTKLMTALIVLEHCEMSEEVVISKEVAEFTRGSVTELREGDVLTVQDLLSCMLVESANNAALSLAIYVAGSEAAFANMMNWEMDRLGGSGSHFVNASGLHNERHFATPYDMYRIYVECRKYPAFCELEGLEKTTYSYTDKDGESHTRTVESTNCFLFGTPEHRYECPDGVTILGSKTGTTPYAGYCMLMHVCTGEGMEYILGVFNAETEQKLYGKLIELMSEYCLE